MANFAIANSTNFTSQPSLGAVYTGLIGIAASSGGIANPPTNTGLRRGKIYDILIGTNGVPADNFIEWIVQRVTAATTAVWTGSISSVSSQFALDPADAAFAAFATVNTTANSSTAFISSGFQQPFYLAANQRASYRWVANPGSEIVYPAVSSATGGNGLVLSARSGGYTGTAGCTIMFSEQ
jgi:hypothetical protein